MGAYCFRLVCPSILSRPDKKNIKCVSGLKTLGRVGTHFFALIIFKNINFSPFKMHKKNLTENIKKKIQVSRVNFGGVRLPLTQVLFYLALSIRMSVMHTLLAGYLINHKSYSLKTW